MKITTIHCEPYNLTDVVEQVLEENERHFILRGRHCRWVIYSKVIQDTYVRPSVASELSIAELLAKGFYYQVTLLSNFENNT